MTCQARSSYTEDEVVWGHRFQEVLVLAEENYEVHRILRLIKCIAKQCAGPEVIQQASDCCLVSKECTVWRPVASVMIATIQLFCLSLLLWDFELRHAMKRLSNFTP